MNKRADDPSAVSAKCDWAFIREYTRDFLIDIFGEDSMQLLNVDAIAASIRSALILRISKLAARFREHFEKNDPEDMFWSFIRTDGYMNDSDYGMRGLCGNFTSGDDNDGDSDDDSNGDDSNSDDDMEDDEDEHDEYNKDLNDIRLHGPGSDLDDEDSEDENDPTEDENMTIEDVLQPKTSPMSSVVTDCTHVYGTHLVDKCREGGVLYHLRNNNDRWVHEDFSMLGNMSWPVGLVTVNKLRADGIEGVITMKYMCRLLRWIKDVLYNLGDQRDESVDNNSVSEASGDENDE